MIDPYDDSDSDADADASPPETAPAEPIEPTDPPVYISTPPVVAPVIDPDDEYVRRIMGAGYPVILKFSRKGLTA